MTTPTDLLVFAHIGDLHLTTADEDNYRDVQGIVAEIADELDFVYLPGDNADNGKPEQYELVRRELDRLPMPVHVITGDHDMEPGSLANFYGMLGVPRLPYAVDARGVRCLFLDICGPGGGGPDFRIGAEQTAWLEAELQAATTTSTRCAVFMHTYPDDLKGTGETEAVNAVLGSPDVLLVDMGHTHYNELANDGGTIFAATRSTGQIEEGPVGYSLAAIDDRTVSWRFKELGAPFPLVLITAPADRRLATRAADPDRPRDTCEVRVSVLGRHSVVRCTCRLDDGEGTAMARIGPGRYAATVPLPAGAHRLEVEAEDDAGRIGTEAIEIGRRVPLEVPRHADGSDRDAIGAWTERGIPGGQLGPNRNGRKW